jgi:hypothetical protein
MRTKKYFLLFMIQFLVSIVFSQNNIQRSVYDLNDPRNPDCPCHKLQKQADQEYARQNKPISEQQDQRVNERDLSVNLDISPVQWKNKAPKSVYRYKRKRKSDRFNDMRFRMTKRMQITRKSRPDFSVCYKW